QSLVQKGVVRKMVRRQETADAAEIPGEPARAPSNAEAAIDEPVAMNGDQQRACAPLLEAVRAGGFHAFLLFGVTGSGKTELYLRAIEETLKQGKQALVLVPEISLTPQTIQRFQGRCGPVAVLHSHLPDAARGAQWRRIKSGHVQVVVGARSAVFA